MHDTSMNKMRYFLAQVYNGPAKVLDVGSRDVNGTYRGLFTDAEYVGLDLSPGPCVDVVGWDGIAQESFDYVISGQTFEHAADDYDLIKKMNAALKPGGHMCIIAPSQGPKHDYPDDYRRYQPEDMDRLAESIGLEILESKINGEPMWYDCVLIAKKPDGRKN